MDRRLVVFAAILAVLLGVAALTQVAITPVPAQMAPPKATGNINDKTVIKTFDAAGLPGIHSIQYRRFTMSPGAKLEGDIVFEGYVQLCMARKGGITITLPDGKTGMRKAGDIWTVPSGTKVKAVVADSKGGFDEFYWSINLKERKD